METKINVITARTWKGYTIEAFNYADTWRLEESAPESWNTLVYRVMKNGKKCKKFPDTAARIGSQLVEDLNRFKTPEGENAFISILKWLSEPSQVPEG